jgi:hypothetical protein
MFWYRYKTTTFPSNMLRLRKQVFKFNVNNRVSKLYIRKQGLKSLSMIFQTNLSGRYHIEASTAVQRQSTLVQRHLC